MPTPDEARRLALLQAIGGGGMLGSAGSALAGRPAAVNAAAGMAPPPGAVPPQPAPGPTMTQSDFGGAPISPEQRAMQQQLLIQKLRQTGRM